MKKILLALTAMMFLPLLVSAQGQMIQSQVFAATGTTGGLLEQNQGISAHNVKWATSGTVSTCTFTIDTSADSVTWSTGGAIAATTCTASTGSVTVYGVSAANFVRINLSTLTGGGSISLTYTGYLNTSASGPVNGQIFSTGSITPTATSAAVQTVAQNFSVTGISATDRLIMLSAPTPTSLCPVTSIAQNGAGSVSLFFSVLTAAACTPAAGTYIFMAVR